ncbi:MAG: homoserine O-succinyltransferase [Chloroflexi bacterium]|nr:homoserine O-succinyltransferase [Chloroflexota bacterium]|tara:strand:+ start:4576 stop:5475 length:900 start_codon:yes stop_codon:yes gene_type:complete
MTLILPKNYHLLTEIERSRVKWVTVPEAERQDIRPLRIGIMNIMPLGETYEFNLLLPLGLSVLQIEPVWIRLESHNYKTWEPGHIDDQYVSYSAATKDAPLDGLIITGAPVEHLSFEEVDYWDEFTEIAQHVRENTPNTLGICWGAFALAYLEGISKINFEQKLFGVYELENLDQNHYIMGAMDDAFLTPQSRMAGMSDTDLLLARDQGKINLLAYGPDSGYSIFETTDQKVLMHQGHPEYSSSRLAYEVIRDAEDQSVPPVHNFDPEHPVNRWRMHRNTFFHQWLRYCYTQISLGTGD